MRDTYLFSMRKKKKKIFRQKYRINKIEIFVHVFMKFFGENYYQEKKNSIVMTDLV